MVHEEATSRRNLQTHPQPVQDPIGRKLCEKLWDDKKSHRLVNLQKCFDEATRAYKQYRVTEHRRDLESLRWKSKRLPTNKNQTVVDIARTTTIPTEVTHKASRITTTLMERKLTTMAQRSSANSALDLEKSTRFASCWMKMQTTLNLLGGEVDENHR